MTTLGYLRAAREWAYPVLKNSAFLEKGVLTPEEFVRAGDELVFRCPTWSWEAGDEKRAKPHLPKDKQFLITRRIPCQKRVAEMENMTTGSAAAAAGNGDDDDEDSDWLVSHVIQEKPLEDEFDILDEEGELINKKPEATSGIIEEQLQQQQDGQEEYADMADFEDDNVLTDDVAAATGATRGDNDDDDTVLLKVRTYDLSITYDKYYQTPRIWMMGYDERHGQPLTGPQMMEDVISDYANRTVTIEAHPHVAGPHASIHPCQHAKVMKTIVRNLIKATNNNNTNSSSSSNTDDAVVADEGPSIEMYLFIFLKFVSSIIPTINYDFTMDVRADTTK